MNTPTLRFKPQSGKSLNNWAKISLGDYIEGHKGGAPLRPSDFLLKGNFEVIPKKAISSGGKLQLDEANPTYCTESFFLGNQRSVVDESYLITTLRDLVPSGPSIGYIVKICSEAKYLLAQGVYGIKIKPGLEEDFLIQYSNTIKYRELMRTMMVGSTQVHIRNGDFFKLQLHIPSIDEQQKIASFLSKIDQKISLLTKKHELLVQYKKGVMQQIFSQEIRCKDKEGKDFPEWEELSLSECAQIIGGGTPETSNSTYWGGTIQWFTPTELKKKYVSTSIRKITDLGLRNSSAKLLPVGVVLFSSRATVGDVAISLNECCTNQGFQSFIPKSGNSNEFLYYWISNNKKLFLEKASGSTFLEISKKEIEKISVQIPSIEEQEKIAIFLSGVDKKIEFIQSQLELTKQYKRGLLQQMFI
ncbi:MAG: hypothetical protein A2X74_09370 [Polynucleobacter sp. GWA2_45_21]|nr:restriction endonuclease subunit S [Polynucleobacter sp. 78F-HAINBA]OHC09976.1 MAG: hypothetical protein A2X74_09370 [Polynucleobacter sp. GWA2_45_21]HBK43048.1 restriction endonuclease subunit S [Polynucleobacter sp.]